MARSDLVLHDAAGHALAELRGQDLARVLVEAAERVVAAIGALERETLGLLTTDAADGAKPAGIVLQVEHGHFHRHGPQVPIVRSEQRAVDPARLIMLAGHDAAPRWILAARGGGTDG